MEILSDIEGLILALSEGLIEGLILCEGETEGEIDSLILGLIL